MFVTRNVFRKYQEQQSNDGGAGGGGNGGDAAAIAAKAAADKLIADKAAADEAARIAAEGGKKPSDEEARLLKENMKKKEALDKAGKDLLAAQEALKKFEGIDPEAVRKLLGEQKTAEEAALAAKGDWERLRTRMAEEHGKETTAKDATIAALQAELGKTKSAVNELSIGTKFSQSKFISEELTLTPSKARVIYGDHFDLEDGVVTGYDKPRGAANRTALVDQYGTAVAFEDALKKIVEADPEKDHLMKSKVKTGAGSESRRGAPAKVELPTDGISKIANGLKGIKQG